jgi:hypothetical protein
LLTLSLNMYFMVYRYALLCVLLGFAAWVQAQPVLTSSSFIKSGDSVRTAILFEPPQIGPLTSGENQTWDLSSLGKDTTVLIVAADAQQGSAPDAFPNASFVVFGPGGEAYYESTPNALRILGVVGAGGFPLLGLVTPRYEPPLIEQRAPMAFFDVNTTDINFRTTFGSELVPPDLLNLIPLPVDSFRFSQTGTRLDVVDGWGTLKIPGAEYEVLRERRRTIVNNKIEIRSFLGWVDLSNFFPIPGAGADTTFTYNFYSEGIPGALAVVTVDPSNTDDILQIQYRDLGVTSVYQPVVLEAPLFRGPNPARDVLNFDFSALDSPARLEIFGVDGRLLHVEEQLQGARQISAIHLPAGMHFYRVMAGGQWVESGKLLFTR